MYQDLQDPGHNFYQYFKLYYTEAILIEISEV
jgi:hypothetical protein